MDIPKRGLFDRAAATRLSGALQQREIDLVHAHNGRTHLAAAAAARWAGRGHCVATQHFIQPNRESRQGLAAMATHAVHGWAASATWRFIAISQAVAEGMRRRRDAPPDRIRVVLHGIGDDHETRETARAQLGIDPQTKLVLCLSRLEPEKDVGTLIDAMRQLEDTSCWIAGDGQQRPELEGRAGNVRLLGFRHDARTLMAACDLLVLPCPIEAFGLVLLEAMVHGKPVVAIKAGGPAEIVEHGRTGFLVPPRQPAEMAGALRRLLDDEPLRLGMGSAGRKRYEALFTRERMAKATLEAYQ
jgi:glycosyltransferase involved in cell wall biosynthesis